MGLTSQAIEHAHNLRQMPRVPSLPASTIEILSKILGDGATGSSISRTFSSLNIKEPPGESTKWKRLYNTLCQLQSQEKSSNCVLKVIAEILAPALFADRIDNFNDLKFRINMVLCLHGVEYRSDGTFSECDKAKSLDEAERRLHKMQALLRGRSIHDEVHKYCRAELMQQNYFHAVFEACKGLAQRIREKGNLDLDGEKLVNAAFMGDAPALAINSLRTETEKSEQIGFGNLVKGCFSAVRNPRAHEPKILWREDNDTADLLTLISLLHRKLDNCHPTKPFQFSPNT